MNSSIIKFSSVSKLYAGNPLPALDNVSFEVASGEFFIIVGPSGCGKSTILKIIANLENTSSGQVQKPEMISMVFQSGALLPWLNVYENIALGLKAHGAHERKIREQVEKYAKLTGLEAFVNKYPHELSGGQKQRVGIARALAVEPQVLLLDEPFSALDTATTEELHKDLIKIWQETKKTIVMVSHSLEEAVTLADRVMVMKAGRITHTMQITLPRPRREQAHAFIEEVHKLRREFFK